MLGRPNATATLQKVGGVDVSDADLDAVLARVGETFDIDREDLRLLLAELELQWAPGQEGT